MIYWFTVDPDRPDDLDVGLRNGLWGVPDGARDRIEPLEPGDSILFFHRDHGFVLCDVDSEPYTESIPVWSDVEYPHRVRLSDPVETDKYVNLGEIHDCLRRARTGEPFEGVAEAEAALGGEGGMLRPLAGDEVRCLFERLGWALPAGMEPSAGAEPGEVGEPAAVPEEAGEPGAVPAAEAERAPREAPAGDEPAATLPGAETGPTATPPGAETGEGVEAAEGPPAGPGEEVTAPGRGRRVILAPAAGNPASQERYADTITEGVAFDVLEEFLPRAEIEMLREARPSGQAHVWGTPPALDQANRGQWEASGPGDIILFTGGGHVFASATVLLTRLDEALAEELWGRREDGKTWKFLYFVTRPHEQDVPYEELNAVAGYEPAYRVPRLNVLEPERSERVLEAFPAFDLAADAEVEVGGGGDEAMDEEVEDVVAEEPGADGEEPGVAVEEPAVAVEEPGAAVEEAGAAVAGDPAAAGEVPEDAAMGRGAGEAGGPAVEEEPDGAPEAPPGGPAEEEPEAEARVEEEEEVEEPEIHEPGSPAEAGEEAAPEVAGEGGTAIPVPEAGELEPPAVEEGPVGAGGEEAVIERSPPAGDGEAGKRAVDLAHLRELLFGVRALRRCALCGRLLPVELLELVFVKPLDACTELEREDIENDVMPACGLGCAALFREGFVVVEDGQVAAGRREPRTDPVDAYVAEIAGNQCEFWHAGSEEYFLWHAREIGDG